MIYQVEVTKNKTIWRWEGLIHRENGPAVIYANGDKEYRKNGKLHKENGPAIIYHNGRVDYYENDKRHNEKGPAIIYADGSETHYIEGKKITEGDFNSRSCKGKIVEIDGVKYELKKV